MDDIAYDSGTSTPQGLILRILSGNHRGAEIELPPGSYVLGCNDSCDIILLDYSLEARHALLTVRTQEDGGEPVLELSPLDGEVAGPTPAEATPFRIGLIALAWSAPERAQESWQAAEQSLECSARQVADEPTSEGPEPLKTPPPDDSSETSQKPSSKEAASYRPDETEMQDGSQPPASPVPADIENLPEGMPSGDIVPDDAARKKAGRRIRNAAGILTACVLTGLLCFTWSDPPPPSTDAVRQALDRAGYKSLSVQEKGGTVLVTGKVASDGDRGRLLELIRGLDVPAFLSLSVGSDLADAVKASFATMGYSLDVSEERSPSGETTLLVKGYILNGVLEELAFRETAANVPSLSAAQNASAPRLVPDIRHETEVSAALTEALSVHAVEIGGASYLPGRVLLRGSFDIDARAKLDVALEDVAARLGVGIPFVVENELENNPAAPASPGQSAASPSPAPGALHFPSGIHIVSASTMGVKFILLDTGQRVFPGGALPNGFVLDDVTRNDIVLLKGNQRIIFPLRGSSK